jgi:hypothetical protein
MAIIGNIPYFQTNPNGSLMKSHGYHGCYFAADSNAIDSSLVIICTTAPSNIYSCQWSRVLWIQGVFWLSQKILVVDIVDLLEEVLNRGLALQIRVYPKARGAAETIINNQEDDDQQRTCWCLVSSIPPSIDPHVGDHVGLVPILNRYHLATPNPRCCGMNARDICCSWRLSRLKRLKNCYECAALIVIVKILNDWCAYELV